MQKRVFISGSLFLSFGLWSFAGSLKGPVEKARGRIFGEAMKQLKGQGDPKQVNEVLTDLLG